MSTSKEQKKKAYQPPTVETVELDSEEAVLAVCSFSASTPGAIFAGAPCSACFSVS